MPLYEDCERLFGSRRESVVETLNQFETTGAIDFGDQFLGTFGVTLGPLLESFSDHFLDHFFEYFSNFQNVVTFFIFLTISLKKVSAVHCIISNNIKIVKIVDLTLFFSFIEYMGDPIFVIFHGNQ